MTALQIVLAYIEAHGTASAAEIHAARPAMTRRAIQRALENLSYRRLIRKAARIPRVPGQRGAQCHRWEIRPEEPPTLTVRQAIASQPSLATVWAKPLQEAA